MKSIHRQVLRRGSVLMIGLGLVGCASNNTSNPSQASSTTSTTSAPAAPATPPAMPNMGGMNAPGGNNAAGAPSPNQMAGMMQQHGGGPPGVKPANSNPNSTPSPDQMASMMKNQQGSAPGGAPPGATPSNDQMAAMMKQYGSSGGGAKPPGTSGAPQGSEAMAAMMKQQGAAGRLGGNSNPAQSNDQMAAMMKQYGGGGGQAPRGAGGAGGPPGANFGTGQPGGAGGSGNNFPPGSVDEALFKFCTAMAEGDTGAASEYISPKAKGMLAELRNGKLSDEKIDEIKNMISPVSELTPNSDQVTNSRRSLINAKNQTMVFVLKKEKDAYKLTELSIPKPRKQ